MMQIERPLKTTLAKYGYLQALPSTYGMLDKFPVIFFFHGYGIQGNGTTDLYKVATTGLAKLIASSKMPCEIDNFIVLSIQSPTQSISYKGIDAFINYAIQTYKIDEARMYGTGLSGGAIALDNYNKYYNRFAATVSISGNTSTKDLMMLPQTPIWFFHDSNDPTVGVNGSAMPYKALKANPSTVETKITIYDSIAHDAWDRTYDLTGFNKGLPEWNFGTSYKPDVRSLDQYNESIYFWMLKHSK